jgi:hypothetical protein
MLASLRPALLCLIFFVLFDGIEFDITALAAAQILVELDVLFDSAGRLRPRMTGVSSSSIVRDVRARTLDPRVFVDHYRVSFETFD